MLGDKDTAQQHWYAVRVKSNREKIVAAALEQRAYEQFLPCYSIERQWSDRRKQIELPLFSGYVFCRLNAQFRLPLLQIPGVVSLVGFGGEPMPLEDHEVAALQAIARSGMPSAPWPFLEEGQSVRIDRGPLRDLEGLVVEVKNHVRLVVSVTLLQRSVAVEVDRDCITPLSGSPAVKRAAASYPYKQFKTFEIA